jgi:hypothetical protein
VTGRNGPPPDDRLGVAILAAALILLVFLIAYWRATGLQ